MPSDKDIPKIVPIDILPKDVLKRVDKKKKKTSKYYKKAIGKFRKLL